MSVLTEKILPDFIYPIIEHPKMAWLKCSIWNPFTKIRSATLFELSFYLLMIGNFPLHQSSPYVFVFIKVCMIFQNSKAQRIFPWTNFNHFVAVEKTVAVVVFFTICKNHFWSNTLISPVSKFVKMVGNNYRSCLVMSAI